MAATVPDIAEIEALVRRLLAEHLEPIRIALGVERPPPVMPRSLDSVTSALRQVGIESEPVTLAIRDVAWDMHVRPRRGWTDPIASVTSALYVLMDGGSVLYVGKSTALMGRLQTHARTRPCTAVAVIPCPIDELNDAEVHLITLLRPPWNVHHRDA